MSETKSAALTVYQHMESPSFLKELAKAIPNTLKPERMVRLALTLLRKNDALAKCSKESIMACVVECSQLGLEPEGVLGHAYIVPFAGVATLIVGYRGFAHLMYQSGMISTLSAEIVRRGDKFSRLLGTGRRLVHVPNTVPMKEVGKKGSGVFEADDPERNWLGAYAAVTLLNGATDFEYLDAALIFAARAKSRSWQKFLKEGARTPWNEYPDSIAMWCKTPIRRLAKRMPTSTTDERPKLLRAVMLDEYGERKGLLVPTLAGFEVNPDPPNEPEDEPPIAATEAAEPSASASSTEGEKSEGVKNPAPVKKSAAKSAAPSNPAVPKANLKGIPAQPAPADDPVIDTKVQTDIYNTAQQHGWQIPDEVVKMLKKKYGIGSIKAVKRSQVPEILTILQSGT